MKNKVFQHKPRVEQVLVKLDNNYNSACSCEFEKRSKNKYNCDKIRLLRILFASMLLLPSLSFSTPILTMNEGILKLDSIAKEQNTKHKQTIKTKANTLTDKAQTLFLLKQYNELLVIEHKIRATNGK